MEKNKKLKKRIIDALTPKLSFAEQLLKDRKEATRMFNPKICYSEEYDIFSINWGHLKIDSTIEANLLGLGDIRFDITKQGMVVGIEIENLTKVLKKFAVDKHKRGKNA